MKPEKVNEWLLVAFCVTFAFAVLIACFVAMAGSVGLIGTIITWIISFWLVISAMYYMSKNR